MLRLILLLLLTSTVALGQQWVTYEITNGIEIDFPEEPTVVDTIPGYKRAFVNTGTIMFLVSETPFQDIGYTAGIRNAEDLSGFYDVITELFDKNPGITVTKFKSDYKNDLLVRWVKFNNDESPPKSCDMRLLLTDDKLFMIQSCTSDTTLADQQSRFLISLNVVGGHGFLSQLEASPEERIQQAKTNDSRGKAIGYTLAGSSVVFLFAWFVLYVIMIRKTRTADASMALTITFTIVRWMAVVVMGLLVLVLAVAIMKNSVALDYYSILVLVIVGGLTLAIAFLGTPKYNTQVIQ